MPSINHNGLTIYYQTDGDPAGTPLLLIMGLGMQLTAWPDSLISALVARGYYLIRFDNRDAGLSTHLNHHGKPNVALSLLKSLFRIRLKSPYLLRDMASDALALMDALKVEQAHVVGVSMGGMIAQILTADHPRRVKTLTSIMSSSGRRDLPGPSRHVRKLMFSRPRDQKAALEHFVKTFTAIGSPYYPTPEPVMRHRIEANMKRAAAPEGTLRQMLAIAASGNRVRELRAITRPTLVIHGTHDPLVPLPAGEDTARLVPGAVLRVIEGMGHDLPEPLMPVFTRMIDDHCQGREIAHAASLLATLAGQAGAASASSAMASPTAQTSAQAVEPSSHTTGPNPLNSGSANPNSANPNAASQTANAV